MELTASVGLDKALGTLVQEAQLRTRAALWREERSSSWEPPFQVAIVIQSVFTPNTVWAGGREEGEPGWTREVLPPSFRPGLMAQAAPVQSSGRGAQAQLTPSS